jgi:acyl-coenzyme A thioesterase 13
MRQQHPAIPLLKLTTINISADFAGYARIGDWLEARVDIQKIGRRLAFANAFLMAGSDRIAWVSSVFARNAGQDGSSAAETRHAQGATPAAAEI